MDYTQLIASVGFPIVACGVMAYYVKYTQDKTHELIENITAKHERESEMMRDTLQNNTVAITELTTLIERKMDYADR